MCVHIIKKIKTAKNIIINNGKIFFYNKYRHMYKVQSSPYNLP